MRKVLQFGVGLISFTLKNATGPIAPAEWTEAVSTSLLTLANVSELDISEDAQSFSFVISIPKHHRDASIVPKVSERYRVRTVTGFFSQCTFVAALDESYPKTGSEGVKLVREQLARQLADDPRIALHFVGPSPFHANFALYSRDEHTLGEIDDSVPIYGRVIPEPGYDYAVFVYDPETYTSEAKALDAVQFELTDELTLFYSEVERRNERMEAGLEILEATEELSSLHSARGFGAAFKRLTRSGAKARALALSVMEAELAIASGRSSYSGAAAAVYAQSAGYFKRFIDRYAQEDYAFYVDHGSKVVKLLEGRRSKEFEVAAISAATVFGGLSGAIVSAVVAAGK